MTSTGIYKHHGFPDFQALRAGCDCGDEAHDHNIFIEVAEDYPTVIVTISSSIEYCDYNVERTGRFYQKIWSRLKKASSILFTGRLVVAQSFYFSDKQHAIDYADAIKDTAERIELKHLSRLQKVFRPD